VSIQTRVIDTPEEREKIYAFRYRVFVEQLGMTREADHDRKWLRDELDDNAVFFTVFDDDQVLGSLRQLYLGDVPDPAPLVKRFRMTSAVKAFGAGAICTTSRFILDRSLTDGKVLFTLMRAAYEAAHKRGARLNYSDCSPHLLPFHEHLGYRRYTSGFNDTANGYKVPILMLTGDHEQFKRVNSPFARVAERFPDDAEVRDWFEKTYKSYVELHSASLIPEGAFFDLLAERVANDPLHDVALLKDLTREQADRFLAQATLVKLYAGDHIIHEGAMDNTLYVLLNGLAEVRAPGRRTPSLGVIGAGDTFGEIGFLTTVPRTADVVATTYCEVLVLSGQFLEQFVTAEPDIGARVLLNLSRELAGRLAMTNQRIVQVG
jgi:N-acyl-L-homoserine lactone synthetase